MSKKSNEKYYSPADSRMEVYGSIPVQDFRERDQFVRMLRLIDKGIDSLGGWAVVLLNFDYRHLAGNLIENDRSWNGQFDMVVLCEHRILLYELKAMRVRLVNATTDECGWQMESLNGRKLHPGSLFDQISKQRTHFLQTYMNGFKQRHEIPEPNHYVVDARLVFRSGSDLSRFDYKPPVDYRKDLFEQEVLNPVLDDEARAFVRGCFVPDPPRNEWLRQNALSRNERQRLNQFWKQWNLPVKVAKWLKVITEDEVASDLQEPSYEEFGLTKEQAGLIADEFGLLRRTD